MNRMQIKIDQYLSDEMAAISIDLNSIMEKQKDLTTESVKMLAVIYGARWDEVNKIRNYIFNMEVDDANTNDLI